MPEKHYRIRRSSGAAPEPGDCSLVSTGKGKPALKCGLCGEILPLRSNLAIAEEAYRLITYLDEKGEASCTNPSCDKHFVILTDAPENHVQFGKTAAGAACAISSAT